MLELIDIHKSYEGQPLLCGISFTVAAGETVCLLGPSGSGKSTLLRMIAGLENPGQGQICWDGEDLASVPAHRRDFGLVFQDYALFPHLNVTGNVAFGLKMQNLDGAGINLRVADILKIVKLTGFGDRHVHDLSGGEQQRVALARVLAPHPRLLMFDEPLGALDRSLREQLMGELRHILHESGVPAIYVTHDQEEAFSLADRVLLLHDGVIVQGGTPGQIWRDPGSVWVACFLGLGNILEGKTLTPSKVETRVGVLKTNCRHIHAAGESVSLLIRPEAANSGEGENILTSHVADFLFQNELFRVTLENGLYFRLPAAHQIGEVISLHVPVTGVECLA